LNPRALVRRTLERLAPEQRLAVIKALAGTFSSHERADLVLQLEPDLQPDERRGLLRSLVGRVDDVASSRLFLSRLSPSGAFDLALQRVGADLHLLGSEVVELTRIFFLTTDPEAAFQRSSAPIPHRESLDQVLELYSHYTLGLSRLGVDLSQARVLDLSPGSSLLGGLLLVAWGAARYEATASAATARVDLGRVAALRDRIAGGQAWPVFEPALSLRREELLERFDALISERDGAACFDPTRIGLQDLAAASPLEPRYQVLLSNSPLDQVQGAPEEWARLLVPGGLFVLGSAERSALDCVELEEVTAEAAWCVYRKRGSA